MNKKRDRFRVMYDIIRTIHEKEGEIKPTHILYKSNLSHKMMEEYLKDLIQKGFIKEKKMTKGRSYTTTEKGREYLMKYKQIVDFIDSFGLS